MSLSIFNSNELKQDHSVLRVQPLSDSRSTIPSIRSRFSVSLAPFTISNSDSSTLDSTLFSVNAFNSRPMIALLVFASMLLAARQNVARLPPEVIRIMLEPSDAQRSRPNNQPEIQYDLQITQCFIRTCYSRIAPFASADVHVVLHPGEVRSFSPSLLHEIKTRKPG